MSVVLPWGDSTRTVVHQPSPTFRPAHAHALNPSCCLLTITATTTIMYLQDVFRRKGAQQLSVLKDVSGVLKPVRAC